MNETRQQNITTIKEKRELKKQKQSQAFIESIDSRLIKLSEVIDKPLKIEDLDLLLGSLNSIGSVQKQIEELSESLKKIVIPDYPKELTIKDLPLLIKTLSNVNTDIKVEWLNEKKVTEITSRLDAITKAVNESKVPQPSQKPSDFIPVRRVIKAGNVFLFDDAQSRGGGGGSSVQNDLIENNRVKVTNEESNYAVRTDAVTTSNVTYVGKAAIGSSTASAVWQVQKVDETTTNVAIITWADGDASFNNVWDNRASLTYS